MDFCSRTALLTTCLTCGLAAQPAPDALSDPVQIAPGRVPIHTAAPDSGQEYGVWAAAESYKAGFAGDATFVPYLGTDYPRTQSVAWHTQSIEVGGVPVADVARPAQRWHDDFRYEYRFGAVTEAYDVRPDGLEQTFTVHSRPAAAGELVITGRLETALRAPAVELEHRGLTFVDAAGRAVVHYGAGTVIDATGRTEKVLTSHQDGQVSLTVPAAWLVDAAFPVTVDPLLTRVTVSAGFVHSSTDIVRDATASQVMVVHARGASASDEDVYAYILDDDLTNRTLVWADVSTWHSTHPRCAVAGDPQRYCVVFERHVESPAFGNPIVARIRYHLRNSGDLTYRTDWSGFDPVEGYQNWRPDIGGQALGDVFVPAGRDFAIVYQTELTPWPALAFRNTEFSGMEMRILGYNGVAGPARVINAGVENERPSVNQVARRPNSGVTEWMVVFQCYDAQTPFGDDDWDVRGRRITSTGSVYPTVWNAPGNDNDPDHRLGPQVAGQSGRYLISYTRRTAFSPQLPGRPEQIHGERLITTRVDWSGSASAIPSVGPENPLWGPFAGPRMQLGACAYDHDTDSHWTITSTSVRTQGGTGRAIVDRLGFQGLRLESQTLQSAGSGEQAEVGGACYDDRRDLFLLSWCMNGSTGRGYANRFTYLSPRQPFVNGTGCSSTTIEWSGSSQIGSEFSGVRLVGGPPGQSAFLMLSLATDNLPLSTIGMPGCYLLVDSSGPGFLGVLGTVFSGGGSGFVSLPLPEPLTTSFVYFQGFHPMPGANPLGLVGTQRLRVHIVR